MTDWHDRRVRRSMQDGLGPAWVRDTSSRLWGAELDGSVFLSDSLCKSIHQKQCIKATLKFPSPTVKPVNLPPWDLGIFEFLLSRTWIYFKLFARRNFPLCMIFAGYLTLTTLASQAGCVS